MTFLRQKLGSEVNRRIQFVAEFIVSRNHFSKSENLKVQLQLSREKVLLIKAEVLACVLRHEVFLFAFLKGKKSRIACFRRRMVYWRMVNSYGLSARLASWILGVEEAEIRKNLGKVYTTLKLKERPLIISARVLQLTKTQNNNWRMLIAEG
jgi:hypothetical protein